jgi:predicted lipoprotein with Yx(FWY)xxD motif
MLSVVTLSASLAIAMTACSGDDPQTATSGDGQTSATTTPAVATTATANTTVVTANSSIGTILVDATGKTLYSYDRDAGGTSSCTRNCAVNFPPLVLPPGTNTPLPGPGVGDLTTTPRPDDATKLQVVWNGKPLYTFAADRAPGDTKGDGLGGFWHAAKPG